MATVNNAVAVVADNGVTMSGTNVSLNLIVQTDTDKVFTTTLTVPISDTAGQLDNAAFTLIQQVVQQFGDTMPSNASLMVLGGKT